MRHCSRGLAAETIVSATSHPLLTGHRCPLSKGTIGSAQPDVLKKITEYVIGIAVGIGAMFPHPGTNLRLNIDDRIDDGELGCRDGNFLARLLVQT